MALWFSMWGLLDLDVSHAVGTLSAIISLGLSAVLSQFPILNFMYSGIFFKKNNCLINLSGPVHCSVNMWVCFQIR